VIFLLSQCWFLKGFEIPRVVIAYTNEKKNYGSQKKKKETDQRETPNRHFCTISIFFFLSLSLSSFSMSLIHEEGAIFPYKPIFVIVFIISCGTARLTGIAFFMVFSFQGKMVISKLILRQTFFMGT